MDQSSVPERAQPRATPTLEAEAHVLPRPLFMSTRRAREDDAPTVVAVINTNPDIVKMLRFALERLGFVVFEIHIEDIRLGSANVDSVLEQHHPKVVVYDVAPPYDMNWRFLQHLRASTGFKDVQFVLTTMNVKQLRGFVGKDEQVYEIVGKQDDINDIARAVKEAARARPTR